MSSRLGLCFRQVLQSHTRMGMYTSMIVQGRLGQRPRPPSTVSSLQVSTELLPNLCVSPLFRRPSSESSTTLSPVTPQRVTGSLQPTVSVASTTIPTTARYSALTHPQSPHRLGCTSRPLGTGTSTPCRSVPVLSRTSGLATGLQARFLQVFNNHRSNGVLLRLLLHRLHAAA